LKVLERDFIHGFFSIGLCVPSFGQRVLFWIRG
jgi:hypothetical protein